MVILKAKTAKGFGGEDWYKMTFNFSLSDKTKLKEALRIFAMKYSVPLDFIKIEEIESNPL